MGRADNDRREVKALFWVSFLLVVMCMSLVTIPSLAWAQEAGESSNKTLHAASPTEVTSEVIDSKSQDTALAPNSSSTDDSDKTTVQKPEEGSSPSLPSVEGNEAPDITPEEGVIPDDSLEGDETPGSSPEEDNDSEGGLTGDPDDQLPESNDSASNNLAGPGKLEPSNDLSGDQNEAQKDGNSDEPETVKPEIPERVVDDGVYIIESSANYQQVLEAASGNTSSGANVQTWQCNMSAAQKWRLTYDSKTGYYTVGIDGTNKVLDVSGGNMRDGANVQLFQSNGTAAQLWRIVKRGDGYVFVSGLRNDLVLDLTLGGSSNGTNVQVFTANGTAAQLFYLLSTKVTVKPGDTINDGSYVIVVGADGSYAADIDGSSLASGANAQVFQANGTVAQRFYFAADGKGYYTITSLASGQVLDAQDGSIVPTTNVRQWASNGSDAQKWALVKGADGSYSIINKATGLVLDVATGKIANGSNLQLFYANGTPAQKFWLKPFGGAVAGDTVLGLDGVYIIESSANYQQVLEAASGNTSSGANVQTWQCNMSAAQKWRLTYDSKTGYYTVGIDGTNKVLDVSGGNMRDGANVQLFQSNGTAAQLWRIVKRGDGYVFVSGLRNDLVLDLTLGGSSNGTNVQVFTANGTAAQLFYLLSTKVTVKPGDTINDGSYVIVVGADGSYAADIDGSSLASGANAQVFQANGTVAQRFYFAADGKGYYTITSLASGQVLDAQDGSIVPTTNVRQWASNGSDAQKWALVKGADGSYSIINKATGLVLDVATGKIANGSNLQLFYANGTPAQKFWLKTTTAITDGIYEIHALANVNKVFDIANGSSSSGAKLQIWDSNGTFAQRFQVVYDATTDSYRIRTAASGGWLTANGNSIIQSGSSATTSSAADTWKFIWNGNFFSFANSLTQMVMGYGSNSLNNGTAMQLSGANKLPSQHFLFTAARLISDGLYEIKSALGMNLDVAGGSSASGANIQTWYDNDESAQKFFVIASGDGYVIKNAVNNLALSVAGNSKAEGANVQQWTANGSMAQLWRAEIADGGRIVFVNVNSGLALDVAGGSAHAGANVQQFTKNDTPAQRWKLEVTTITWANVDGTWYFYYETGGRQAFTSAAKYAWEKARDKGSQTNYLVTIDNDNYRTVVFQRSRSGVWEPIHDWLCGVGSPTLGLTFRGESYVMKKGPVMGIDPQEYWWTEFYNNGADPTGEGQRFHSILYWRGSYTNVYEDGRGGKNSHGCVRLLLEQAKWIYDYIPYGTKVYSF